MTYPQTLFFVLSYFGEYTPLFQPALTGEHIISLLQLSEESTLLSSPSLSTKSYSNERLRFLVSQERTSNRSLASLARAVYRKRREQAKQEITKKTVKSADETNGVTKSCDLHSSGDTTATSSLIYGHTSLCIINIVLCIYVHCSVLFG